MNVVFIGSSMFGLRCLKTCIELPGINVTGIVTAPRTFAISYCPSGVTNVLHADFSGLAGYYSIPIRTLENSMNEVGLLDDVANWKPDIFLVAGWYHMLPKCWRELAPAYGLHASILPDYSGGAPLVWAIINGEKKTGITLFKMDDGVDSGPIAGQKEEPIRSKDTISTLYARIEECGLELVREVLPKLANRNLDLHQQDESKRRIFPQRTPEDGLINWQYSASAVDCFIRAQTRPYPGAYTIFEGRPLYIWQAYPVTIVVKEGKNGCVHRMDDGRYIVTCGTEAIILYEVTYHEKKYVCREISELFGDGKQKLGK